MALFTIILLIIIVIQYFTITIQLNHIKHQNHFLIIKQTKMAQTQEEAAQALANISAQLQKAKGEIVSKIQALTDAAANADSVEPALQTAIDNLAPIAQALDDIVPDAPADNQSDDGNTDAGSGDSSDSDTGSDGSAAGSGDATPAE